MKKQITAAMLALLLGFFGACSVIAQDQDSAPPQVPVQNSPDPNSQDPQNAPAEAPTDAGAARISFIQGDVSMQRGDSGDWSAVTLNTPLMTGDKVATNDGSRAEIQLDYANVLRLDHNAQANVATLTRTRIQVQMAQGLANYSVLKGSEADIEIDTPNVAVHPLKEGRYRVEVNADGDSEVTVRDGEAEISTPQGSTKVKKGDLITIHGTSSEAQYKVSDAPSNDDWDKWNKDRDGVILNARSWQDTNPYYTGSQDLDQYGVWSEVPDYGPVWVPTVGVGWAPYRAGRWLWEPYYGWTWVSAEPWGWAPYHYGRWFLYGNSWAWWPGPVYRGYRPLWAPAYVSFFGFGAGGVGFGFGAGFGSIGWLPIGPGDFFHPWWGGYRNRFGGVNVTNVYNIHDGIGPLHGGDRFSNLHNALANDRMRQGISSVSAGSFGRGSVVARGVSADEFRQGRMMTGNVPVVPTRDSLRASDRPVSAAMAARGNTQQRFFSTRAPAAGPQSFSEQASHMQDAIQNGGRSNGVANAGAANADRPASTRNGETGAPPSFRPPTQAQGSQGRSSQGQSAEGWHSFGSDRPATATNESQPRAESQGQQGGWQRSSPQSNTESVPRDGNNGTQPNNLGGSRPSYRPPLDMSKPIVNQRSSGGNEGGNRAAPSYRNAPSGGYGGRPAPRPSYRSAPSGGYRAPSGGGHGGSHPARSGGGGGGHHR